MKTITIRNNDHLSPLTCSITRDHLTFQGEIEADDDYHTFDELYDHRYALFLAVVKQYWQRYRGDATWCSQKHADGTMFDDMFILGIYKNLGNQITYHLPLKYWDEAVRWAIPLDRAPEWDGHSARDVLTRLAAL